MTEFVLWAILTLGIGVWLSFLFVPVKTRVRKLDLGGDSLAYVYGTVEKTFHDDSFPFGRLSYWTVRWDDEPLVWDTLPCHSFIWHQGYHTLLTK